MHLLLFAVLLFSLAVPGCAQKVILPVVHGSQSEFPQRGSTAVVWGQHKSAVGRTVTILQSIGLRIVERSRLQQVFDEQKTKLTYSPDDDAQILKVGKILGADSIVFVETGTSSMSVSVRGVNVENGEVMWSGIAHYPQAINNPEAGIVYLTESAVFRGLCFDDAWNDEGGCDFKKAFGTGRVGLRLESKNTPEGRQLLVTAVTPNSPAEQAGLKVGDVLLSCNGRSGFQNSTQYAKVCRVDAGQSITLQVKREGKLTTISATADSIQN